MNQHLLSSTGITALAALVATSVGAGECALAPECLEGQSCPNSGLSIEWVEGDETTLIANGLIFSAAWHRDSVEVDKINTHPGQYVVKIKGLPIMASSNTEWMVVNLLQNEDTVTATVISRAKRYVDSEDVMVERFNYRGICEGLF